MNNKVLIAGLVATCVLVMALVIPMSGDSEGVSYTDETTGLVYTLNDDGTAEVGNNTSLTGDVVIPATLQVKGVSYTVTSVASKAFQKATITSIEFPDTITTMGTYALDQTSKLTSVKLPAGLTSIPNYFLQKSAIETITLPATVSSIGNYAFKGCGALKSVDLSDLTKLGSIGSYAFQTATSLETLELPDHVITIGTKILDGCSKLADPVYATIDAGKALVHSGVGTVGEDLDIADGTDVLMSYSISACEAETVNVPASVTTFQSNVFNSNSHVKSVVLADGSKLVELGGSSFAKCTALESFNLEKATGLEKIGATVFSNCSSLKSLQIAGTPEITAKTFSGSAIENPIYSGNILAYAGTSPDFTIAAGTTTILGYAFNGSKVTDLVIPATVTTLEKYAFNSSPLKSITIPGTVTDMTGGYTFEDSTSLETIVLSEGITSLPDYFADGCTSLKEINFPASLKTIGKYAFMGAAFTELVIPATVEQFMDYSFRNNKSLVSFEVQGTPVFGSSMFYDCVKLESFKFPSGTEPASSMFDGCTALENVTLPAGIEDIPSYLFCDCSSMETVSIPDTVTLIDSQAFRGTSSLKNVEFPSGLVKIGSYAFRDSGLTSVVLPENVSDLTGGSTFYGCKDLASVAFKAPYIDVGSNLFYNCSSLKTVEINGMLDGNASTFNKTSIEEFIVSAATPFVTANMANNLSAIVAIDDCGCKYLPVTCDGKASRMLLSAGEGCNVMGADYCCAALDVLQSGDISSYEDNKHFTLSDGFLFYGVNYLVSAPYSQNLVIPDSVKELGPYAVFASDIDAPYGVIELASSVERLHCHAISSPVDVVIAPGYFEGCDCCIPDDARLYLVDTSKEVVPVVTGFAIITDDVSFLVDYAEGADLTATAYGEYLAVDIILQEGYDRSDYVVYANGIGYAPSGVPTIIDGVSHDGVLIGPVKGCVNVAIDGIALNTYTVETVAPAGTVVYGNTEGLVHGTAVTFNIGPATGYRFSESFSVLVDGTPVDTVANEGYCTFSFTILDDVELEIVGIEPADSVVVTYNVNGGTTMEAGKILPGTAFHADVPVKEGCAFLGWYTDAEFKTLFYNGTGIDADTTLYAKWTDSDKTYKVEFDVIKGQGSIIAQANGHMDLQSGDRVPAGSDVAFVFVCDNPYEPVIWNVSGDSEDDYASYKTFCVDSDISVGIVSEYMYTGSFMNTVYMETAFLENYEPLWILQSKGSNFKGMYYTPGVIGDYLYSKCDNLLVKIDSFTGEVVKTVKTAESFSGYYQYVCVGNNLIVDGHTGNVYNTELEQVFTLSQKNLKTFYHDGMFFVTDSKEITHAFSAVDADTSKTDEIHEPLWSLDVGSRVTSFEGGSTILFMNGFAATIDFVDIDGESYPQFNTFNYKTGERIDSYTMLEMPGVSGEKGYIDISEGYLTVTTYGTGLFESDTGEPLDNIGIIEIDAYGNLDDASYRSFYTGATQSYHSAFIVEQGLGFVAGGDYFMVYDMETLELVTMEELPIACGHGSMTTAVSDGKLRAYIVPYQSSTDLISAEYDFATGNLRTYLLEDVAIAQWGSQQARFLENGSIVFVNDGGNIYCVGGIDSFRYTVQHVSTDGEVLGVIQGVSSYGDVIEYADLASSFKGYTLVDSDRTFTVSASHQANVFTILYDEYPEVTWVIDGIEYSENYAVGETPVFDGTPVKESTESSDYTFVGWSPEVIPVTGDAVYTAVFEESVRMYTVSFYQEDGTTLIKDVETAYGSVVVAPEAPVKPAGTYPYEFSHWATIDGTPVDITAPVTGDAACKAVYRMVVPSGDLYDVTGEVTVNTAKTVIDLSVTLTEGAEPLDSAVLVVIACYDDGRFVNSYPPLDLDTATATVAVSTNGLTSIVVEVVDSVPGEEYVVYGGYVYTVATE